MKTSIIFTARCGPALPLLPHVRAPVCVCVRGCVCMYTSSLTHTCPLFPPEIFRPDGFFFLFEEMSGFLTIYYLLDILHILMVLKMQK
jgi:hypothetical protein